MKWQIRKKFKTPESVCEAMLWTTREKVIVITPTNPMPTICRDLADNNILQLAEFVNANFIVTGDKDLLDLTIFDSTKIVTPRIFHDSYIAI